MGSASVHSEAFLIIGNGWIANQLRDIMVEQDKDVIMSGVRIENRDDVLSELVKHRPTRVINCAGVRGYPNADWCEDHKVETMRTNVLGVLNVVDLCFQLGIHVTHIGSACIYTLSEEEIRTRPPFKETDKPFFAGCWYGRSRLLSELSIRHYPNLLLLRIRLPIAADFHKNNHITRLLNFEKIVDLTGSGSILPNLLPGAVILSEHAETGIYNFVTPGEISNVEIMTLAKEYILPDLEWETFELEAMLKTLKASRANCIVDAGKLQKKLLQYGYEVKNRREALVEVFELITEKGLQYCR